ncbi:hypothetical protein [Marinobacterium iners]|uniref:Uncharacterized protein n=1 Tax=Marinobacterium iners DSM 11526 TaxID=1122198 RepID=A0A1H4FPW1_9GAMM|nr:hypothetical protein [Marinobacterium iners]SEA99413.1 hypothetical protein SAMN02745729_11256 [Marinobacterium iners DSM 11526]
MAGAWPEIEAMELPEFPQCVQTGLQLTQLLAMPFVTAHRWPMLLRNLESITFGPNLNSTNQNEVMIRENSPQGAGFVQAQRKQATNFF